MCAAEMIKTAINSHKTLQIPTITAAIPLESPQFFLPKVEKLTQPT